MSLSDDKDRPVQAKVDEAPSIKLVFDDCLETSSTSDSPPSQNDAEVKSQAQSPVAQSGSQAELHSNGRASPTGAEIPAQADPAPVAYSTSEPIQSPVRNTLGDLKTMCLPCLKWLWDLRAPLLLLLAIALCPKLVAVWILIVLAKPVCMWIYKFIPPDWKLRLQSGVPSPLRRAGLIRDLGEGADQGLPFILFWLYLCCAPFALVWIGVHWLRGFFPKHESNPERTDSFVFTQNRRPDPVHSETNFYYSRAFGIVFLAFFALGIPAFCSYSIFQATGMEKTMSSVHAIATWQANSSKPPAVSVPQVGLANRPPSNSTMPMKNLVNAPYGSDVTYICGYNGYWPWLRHFGLEPNKSSVFFVHFYLVSLASALCMLFFRTWFLFPLNFLSDEHDIEFTEQGIRRKSLKGWFLTVLTINRWASGGGPDYLIWREVKSLRYMEEGYTRLCPLPETAFKKESLTYKLLNKLAAFIDGVSSRLNSGSYLVFSAAESDDFGRNMCISLKDLNREQRAKLFYSVKKWAPHVTVQKSAEEKLLGSVILHDQRYTQLWFDMLTSRNLGQRQGNLLPNETLRDGQYTISERFSGGGQATTYLAKNNLGAACVLKEFILATASTSATLIDSAREFEAEVSLLSQLEHPGIVRLLDFFVENGRVYVALEYVEGRTLRQVVQENGPLDEQKVLEITESVCDILEYLHGRVPPIVHRDVTPENIIMSANGEVKLIDFSLAVKQDGRLTTNSCAKQAFTPPEQFRDDACPQSDIYALGATMFYLLTGAVPKPISCSSPQNKNDKISPQLNAIVERATKLDLRERYESAHWLKLDLSTLKADNALLALEPVSVD
jgi:hypothetical protein